MELKMHKSNIADCLRQSGLILSMLAAVVVVGCGGGGGGGSSATSTCLPYTTDPTCASNASSTIVTQLSLTVDSPTLQTDGASVVTINATLKDKSSGIVKGETVNFSVDSGSLSESSVKTDATTGVATVTFDSNDNKANREVKVRATYQSLVKETTITVLGSRLGFGGDSSGVIGENVVMTVTLLDGAGKAIANQGVAVKSSLGNPVPATVTTNASGLATLTFKPTISGADVITISALGASAVKDLPISAINFAFTSPASNATVAINTCREVEVQLVGGVTGTSATFTSSRGSAYMTLAACDADVLYNQSNPIKRTSAAATVAFSGTTAKAYVTSPSAGAATVSAILTASSGSGTTAKREISFVSLMPTQIVVQADPSTLSPNSTGNIYAIVRDDSGNPVAGSKVIFTAPSGGGQANPSIADTDASGVASTTFKADPNLTGKDAVTVVATVLGTSVTQTTQLTVAGQGVNIVIGTDNLIVKSDNPPRYTSVWGVFVTDTAGNPVRNQAVTIALRGIEFQKGSFEPGTGINAGKWVMAPEATCFSEDANNDGFFQSGELGDQDGDGVLEPNGAALVTPPVTSATASTSVMVTTDNSGAAAFWVVYPPAYAAWTKIELKVTAAVAGQNNTATRSFYLPYLASEVSDLAISPSFHFSPFGTRPSCIDKN